MSSTQPRLASSDAPILLTVPWVADPWVVLGPTLESRPEVIDRTFFNALREHQGALTPTSLNSWLMASLGDIGTLPRANINFESEVLGRTTTEQLTRALATLEMHTPLDEHEAELRQDTLDTLRWLAQLSARASEADPKPQNVQAHDEVKKAFEGALGANPGVLDAASLNAWVKDCVGDVGTLPRNSLNFERDLNGKTTTTRLRVALKILEAHSPRDTAEAVLKQRALDSLRWMAEMAARGGL